MAVIAKTDLAGVEGERDRHRPCQSRLHLRGEAVRAVDDVSLSVRANEFFTLLGPSGCGKTTLLRLIAGFEQPTAGAICSTAGRDRPAALPAAGQHGLPELRAVPAPDRRGQRRLRPADAQARARREIAPRVARALDLVRLAGSRAARADQLSGGQQQRVALARALVARARGPAARRAALARSTCKLRKAMQVELKRLQRDVGITFVFVTHDQEEALTMSDRIAVMNEGRIEQLGTPARDLRRARQRASSPTSSARPTAQGRAGAGRWRPGRGRWRPTRGPGADPLRRAGSGRYRCHPARTCGHWRAIRTDPARGRRRERGLLGTDTQYHLAVGRRRAARGPQPEHQGRLGAYAAGARLRR